MWFRAATHSFGLFFLRRVLCGALPYRFSNSTHSFGTFFLRRVPSGGSAVWFRAATHSFGLFFLRHVLFNEFFRGERVGQARDDVSDQNRMIRISGATRYGVARMNRSHCARKYGTMIRYWL